MLSNLVSIIFFSFEIKDNIFLNLSNTPHIQDVYCVLVDTSDEHVDLTIFLIFISFQFLLFLTFEGTLFSLFTSIMFGTQVSAIWYDETAIESLKKEETRWVRWWNENDTLGISLGLHMYFIDLIILAFLAGIKILFYI